MKTALLTALILSCAPLYAQQVFPFWPQGGEPGQDLAATNFRDHGGLLLNQSFRCDSNAVNNHSGTDVLVRSFAETNIGIPLFAALDGTVCSLNDSAYDQCTSSGKVFPGCNPRVECTVCTSNHVHLVHAGGLVTYYRHMRQDGIPAHLRAGSCVKAGEQIGWTGSSGAGSWPHVHFQVVDNGTTRDPFDGPCNPLPGIWKNQPQFQTGVRMWNLGVSNVDSSSIAPPLVRAGGGFVESNATSVYVWGNILALGMAATQNKAYSFQVLDPNGTPMGSPQVLPPAHGKMRIFHESIPLPGPSLALGTWSIVIDAVAPAVMPQVVAPFEVVAVGTTAPNQAPVDTGNVVFDPPQPTAANAIFCRFQSAEPAVRDADYDVARYHYVWTNLTTGTVIRDVVHAGRADAIPRQPSSANVQCCVTAEDGRGGLSSTKCVSVVVTPSDAPGCGAQPIFDCSGSCKDFMPTGWRNLGHAKKGYPSEGLPFMKATASAIPGQTFGLAVERGTSNAIATLFLSTTYGNTPFACTTLIPGGTLVSLTTTLDAAGKGNFSISIPSNIGSGADFYFQSWISDSAASSGLGATNGLVGTVQ